MRDAAGAAAGGGARLREAAPRACGRLAQRPRRGSLGLHAQPAPPLSPCQCCRPRKGARGADLGAAGPARSGRAGGSTGVSHLPAVGCQGHRALRPLPRHLLPVQGCPGVWSSSDEKRDHTRCAPCEVGELPGWLAGCVPRGAVTGTNGVDVCHRAALRWQLLALQIVGGSPQGSFCSEVLLKVALGSPCLSV